MKKKKNIIILCSLIFAVLMIPVILVSFAFGLKPQYDLSFYGGMAIKYDRLYHTKGKKIVIIGGSSVAFGVRSDILELELGMPVVNFGLYANLGTKFMLDVAEDAIKEDDIVIIAPEQNPQALSMYFNGEAVWYSVDGCYDVLKKVKKENYGDLAKNFLKFTSGKFNYWQAAQKPKPNGVYNVDSFNAYGDIEYVRPYNMMNGGFDAGTPISFEKEVISNEFIAYLNKYSQKLFERGADVFYSFCPMNKLALSATATEERLMDYNDYISSKLTFDFLGNPVKRIMDSEWFYDSNFHLNDSGAIYYTVQLAQDIKSKIGDYNPIKTQILSAPRKPDEQGTSGTLSKELEEAAKIFNLSGVDITIEAGEVTYKGQWVIEGLTEYGNSLAELTLPDTLMDLPVTTIADRCFENANVEKLIFGSNISTVNKAAFDGCMNLQEIYITSHDPNSFHPAFDILDGLADCAFYIPEEFYMNYILDYFWGYLDGSKIRTY